MTSTKWLTEIKERVDSVKYGLPSCRKHYLPALRCIPCRDIEYESLVGKDRLLMDIPKLIAVVEAAMEMASVVRSPESNPVTTLDVTAALSKFDKAVGK